MKTYQIHSSDGNLIGFEVTSAWVLLSPLMKILKSVAGVTEVKRQWFNEDRVIFKYHGIPAVVNEPWGDNSRYWLGFQEPGSYPEINLEPLHKAFINYKGGTVCYSPSRDT